MDGIERTINLLKFLTPVSRDNADVQALASSETVEMQELWDTLCTAFNDQFIRYMTDFGLERWEEIFDVLPRADDTYDDRRTRILTLIAGSRPYTLKRFQEMLDGIFGAGNVMASVDGEKYQFRIDITGPLPTHPSDLFDFVEEIVPKNLELLYWMIKEAQLNIYTGSIVQLQSTRHLMTAPLPDTALQNLYIGMGQRFGGQQSVRVTVPEREQMDIAVGLRLGYHGLHKVNAEYTEPPTIQNMSVDMPVITGAFLLRGGQQRITIRMPTGETTGYNTGMAIRHSGVTSIAPAMHAKVDSGLMVGCFLRGAIAGKITCRKEDM